MKSEIDLDVQSLKEQSEMLAGESSSQFTSQSEGEPSFVQSEGEPSFVSSPVRPTPVSGAETFGSQSVTDMEQSESFWTAKRVV